MRRSASLSSDRQQHNEHLKGSAQALPFSWQAALPQLKRQTATTMTVKPSDMAS
jgi:hypothetical protein